MDNSPYSYNMIVSGRPDDFSGCTPCAPVQKNVLRTPAFNPA